MKSPSFIHSLKHIYGCYGAIFFCVFVLFKVWNLNWFAASLLGYMTGRFIYFLKTLFAKLMISSPPSKITLATKSQNILPPKLKPHTSLDAFSQFAILKYQIETLLPSESQKKLQDIQALLNILNKKTKSTHNKDTLKEIAKIQRIIHQYLIPSMTYYHSLPAIFHNRPSKDEKTPNDLILEQFSLVYDELIMLTEYLFQDNLEALIQHGEFLEQKFQPPEFFKVGKQLEENNFQ